MRLPLILAAVALAGCGSTGYRDTTTVHNPEASRLWLIQKDGDRERVVLCESSWPGQARPLCLYWPAPPPAAYGPPVGYAPAAGEPLMPATIGAAEAHPPTPASHGGALVLPSP